MAKTTKKYSRQTIGSVMKSKTGSKYIKINLGKDGGSVTLNQGDILSVESKAEQLASLDGAVDSGKLSTEIADKVRERINKIPEFVIAEVVLTNKG